MGKKSTGGNNLVKSSALTLDIPIAAKGARELVFMLVPLLLKRIWKEGALCTSTLVPFLTASGLRTWIYNWRDSG